jgi:hypothetical protein
MIAGEALLGLLFAGLAFAEIEIFELFESPSYLVSLACIAIIGAFLIVPPLKKAQRAN